MMRLKDKERTVLELQEIAITEDAKPRRKNKFRYIVFEGFLMILVGTKRWI